MADLLRFAQHWNTVGKDSHSYQVQSSLHSSCVSRFWRCIQRDEGLDDAVQWCAPFPLSFDCCWQYGMARSVSRTIMTRVAGWLPTTVVTSQYRNRLASDIYLWSERIPTSRVAFGRMLLLIEQYLCFRPPTRQLHIYAASSLTWVPCSAIHGRARDRVTPVRGSVRPLYAVKSDCDTVSDWLTCLVTRLIDLSIACDLFDSFALLQTAPLPTMHRCARIGTLCSTAKRQAGLHFFRLSLSRCPWRAG